MRFSGWFCLVLGVAFLFTAGMLGIHAIQQATEISAFHHARACPADAPPDAGCLHAVHGSVAAVTEFPGGYRISADYALDVRTASTTLHLTFSSASPMLGYAVDGDPAVVTMWRGVPVSVMTGGRSGATTSVPGTALADDLRNSAETGGAGAVFILGALAIRANRRAGGAQPSRARAHGMAEGASGLQTPALPTAPPMRTARTLLPARMHPANWARVPGARAAAFLSGGLAAAVLVGVFLTSQDGPPARAFRHAPACVGETNLATCAGDFTAVINGVRAPANGANFADVSYATDDGAVNSWARFDGNAATIVRLASADENARTPLRIRVWRRSIVGAELGGSWHWAQGNPPGDTIPAVLLAVSFALLLLVARLWIHLRPGPGADSQQLLIDDLGQVALAACSIVLLVYGFWPGAILALAVLLWLGLSVRKTIVDNNR